MKAVSAISWFYTVYTQVTQQTGCSVSVSRVSVSKQPVSQMHFVQEAQYVADEAETRHTLMFDGSGCVWWVGVCELYFVRSGIYHRRKVYLPVEIAVPFMSHLSAACREASLHVYKNVLDICTEIACRLFRSNIVLTTTLLFASHRTYYNEHITSATDS